jgi:hypothetical protein
MNSSAVMRFWMVALMVDPGLPVTIDDGLAERVVQGQTDVIPTAPIVR